MSVPFPWLVLVALSASAEPETTVGAAEAATSGVDLFAPGDPSNGSPPAPLKPPATPPLGALPDALRDGAERSLDLPLPARMKAVSEPLLGLPYLVDPLGEGSGHDPDPLARYDAFDCLTFVEEVLALALAGDPVHAAPIRLGLRYDGSPSYADRHHFMELQWIPSAIADGWLRDATGDYGATVRFEREVTDSLWRNWSGRAAFALTDEQLPTGLMGLDVLPLDEAIAAADRLRPGSIVLTVREDRPWVPLWITHLGIVIEHDGARLFRHASRMKSGPVTRDNRLRPYLELLGSYKNWKTAGVVVLEPIEFGPRRSRLVDNDPDPPLPALIVWPDGRELRPEG